MNFRSRGSLGSIVSDYYYYLFTAIGFAPGGSGPYTTQLQQKNIQYRQQKTYKLKQMESEI
jgi:hypothetical protein